LTTVAANFSRRTAMPNEFSEHFAHLATEICALAADVAAVAATLPPLDAIEQHMSSWETARRVERERDLVYALVGAHATLEQAREWLRRALRAGT
jgi:hypothetical protein